MKFNLKPILIPAVSAVVGGSAVVAALKMSPEMRSKLESPSFNKSDKKVEDGHRVFDSILKEQKGITRQFDQLFNDEFFGQRDPFAEMKKMREEMEKRLNENGGPFRSTTNPFDAWFSDRFGGGSVNDISKREDENYVYYDLKIDDVKSSTINTKVENGYITITGSQEKNLKPEGGANDGSSTSEGFFKSTFSRTLPLPDNVDATKIEMHMDNDKVVLQFPKVKA